MVLINPIGDDLQIGSRIYWDHPTRSLYYVDIPKSTIYKYKPATEVITKAQVGTEPLSFAFPVQGEDDRFIAGLGRKIVVLKWDGVTDSACSCTTLREVERQEEFTYNRLNGAKVDPYGRLWIGTMGPQDENGDVLPGKGSLYSLTRGKLKCHLNEIGISNGLAFDVKMKKMYYVDTLFPGIYQFDYDGEAGEISNKKIIFNFGDHGIIGSPDGLTMDEEGNLWVTVIFGSLILKIDPTAESLLKKIEMPTYHVTSLCWGNENLNVLYATTGKILIDGKVPVIPAGCTFKLERLEGCKGLPGNRYKLN